MLIESAQTRPIEPERRISTIGKWLFVLLTWVVLAPPVLANSPPPVEASEPLYTIRVGGTEGGQFSRFEVEIYLDASDSPPSLENPEALPRLNVIGYQTVSGHEFISDELELGPELWIAVAELMQEVDWVWLDTFLAGAEKNGLEGFTPGRSARAAERTFLLRMEDFIVSIEPLIDLYTSILVTELQEALESQLSEILVIAANGQVGCPKQFVKAFFDLVHITLETHPPLLKAIWRAQACSIAKSQIAPLSLRIQNGYVCAVQLGSWVAAWPPLVTASAELLFTFKDLSSVVSGATEDRVGAHIAATSYYADEIARKSKTSEVHTLTVERSIESVIGWVSMIRAHSQILDFSLAEKLDAQLDELNAFLDLWTSECMPCQRRVIAPRFEASSIRVRPYQVTAEGAVHWKRAQYPDQLTAMARDVARESVWEIEASEVFASNPEAISAFNPVSQSQTLSILTCEGVILNRDPNPLGPIPEQRADTPYILESNGSGEEQFPTFGGWPAGINYTDTILPVAFPGGTTHRACEDGTDGETIDNNNDGMPDESPDQYCGVRPGLPEDPDGEFEEDAYLHPVLGPVQGKTQWRSDFSDVVCTGLSLELVSKGGLTGQEVQTETILDVGSYWTDPITGEAVHIPQHPQDSTQIRFRIRDDDWGKPRPHACYRWDRKESEWICRARARGCDCVPEREPAGGRF